MSCLPVEILIPPLLVELWTDSKDIESVDQDLAPLLEYLSIHWFNVSQLLSVDYSCLLIGAVIVVPCTILPFTFTLVVLELKRFDSITKSPIMQHFSETLVSVFLLLGEAWWWKKDLSRKEFGKIDANNKPFFYLWVANRWLAAEWYY